MPTAMVFVVQKSLEFLVQCRIGAVLEGLIERHHDPPQQPVLAAWRVGDEADRYLRVEAPQEITQQSRFARADFTGNDREAGTIHHPEFEHGEREAVIGAPVDQIRVRQNGEGLFPKPVKGFVHLSSPRNLTAFSSFASIYLGRLPA